MILNDLRFRRLLSFVLALLFCFTLFADPLAVRGHAVAVVDDLAVVGVVAALAAAGISIVSLGNTQNNILETVRGWFVPAGVDTDGISSSVIGAGAISVTRPSMVAAQKIAAWLRDTFGIGATEIPVDQPVVVKPSAAVFDFGDYFGGTFSAPVPLVSKALSVDESIPVPFYVGFDNVAVGWYYVKTDSGSSDYPFSYHIGYYDGSDYYDIYSCRTVRNVVEPIFFGLAGVKLNSAGTAPAYSSRWGITYWFRENFKHLDPQTSDIKTYDMFTVPYDWLMNGQQLQPTTNSPAVSVSSGVYDPETLITDAGVITAPSMTFTDAAGAVQQYTDAISLGETVDGEYSDEYEKDEPYVPPLNPDYTDSLNDLKTGVGTAVDALEGLQTSVDDLNDRVAAQDIPIEEVQSGGRAGLATIFPFCIPFDLVDFLRTMNAARAAPHFEVPLDFGDLGSFTMEIDLSDWDPVAQILRTMELLLFCVGLVLLTRNIIRG